MFDLLYFHFHLFQNNFLFFISSLTYWLFRSVFGSFNISVVLTFLFFISYGFIPLWSEKIVGMISIFLSLLKFLCILLYDLSLRMSCVYLRRMCILLLLFGMFRVCLLRVFVLKCGSTPMLSC